MSFEDLDFDFDFNFTSRTRCPHCKTSMIIIDRKILFCPLCELERNKKAKKTEMEISLF